VTENTHIEKITVTPKEGIIGDIKVPGDKSISHRAVILGSLACGTSIVKGFLESEDCLNTLRAFQRMGVKIEKLDAGVYSISGVGIDGLSEPDDVIDIGNSGTAIRLLCGVLAGQKFYSVITGDESIRRRPMGRVVNPLRDMGAQILGRENGEKAPLSIYGGELRPIHHQSSVASAQVKSAILLAGLFAEGETSVTEPALSRNHTELMLRAFGADVRTSGTTAAVVGRPELTAQQMTVPGDISSAAYFIVAAIITPNSRITVRNTGINPTRTGIIDALQAMGADIQIENVRSEAGEPTADITAKTSRLFGIKIAGDLIPRLIDEVPILAVAAAVADGTTIIADAQELRVKETDRIASVKSELSKMGARIEETQDGMIIRGVPKLTGAVCDSHGDHRIAMSCLIAGLAAEGETTVLDTKNIATSFPGFADLLASL
jgi:3-phosphoshikimate 1-carboxyvinyltransferase